MPKLQQSWVRSQHPPTQWNLRGGRCSSVEYSTEKKKNQKNPPEFKYCLFPVGFQSVNDYCYAYFPTKICVKGLRSEMDFLEFLNDSKILRFLASIRKFSHYSERGPGGRGGGVVCCTCACVNKYMYY